MLLKFEVYRDDESWCARGIGVNVFIQEETLDDLLTKVKEALALQFEERLERGETLQILILAETEVRGKPNFHSMRKSAPLLPAKEMQRRKELVERILARRAQLPVLGMTTAELVRLARQGLESYDAS